MKNLMFLIVLLALSCNEDDNPAPQVNIDVGVGFYVLDQEGNDLLDESNPNHLNLAQIKVFYLVDGVKKEVNNPNLDNPKGYGITPPEGNYDKYRFGLVLNFADESNTTTTFLEWSENNTDTFLAELKREKDNGSIICTKVTYNDLVVFDVTKSSGDRFFEIVK